MDLLEKYIQELSEELKIDEMNISEVQRRLPARRHFWIARLINHKRDLNSLQRKRRKRGVEIAEGVRKGSAVRVTIPESIKIANQSEEIKDIDDEIREIELIIEFLEKTEKNLDKVSWDIGNIVKLMQMEMM